MGSRHRRRTLVPVVRGPVPSWGDVAVDGRTGSRGPRRQSLRSWEKRGSEHFSAQQLYGEVWVGGAAKQAANGARRARIDLPLRGNAPGGHASPPQRESWVVFVSAPCETIKK